MKILKKILIIVLCLVALPFVVALFIPYKYTVSVTETIHQPRQVVFDYIRMLKNQKDYSIWVMSDPNMLPVITGTDGSIGAKQNWNSKLDNVGEGEQEIVALTPDRMDVDLRFVRPMKSEAKAANILKSISETETQITSEFYSDSKYPMNLPSYIFGRKYIREAQAQNLKNIKKILEQK
ncbi:MAG: SRPBCC family protein [bacterium]|nr:SRPBCC family protein [bacterium]